MWLLAAYIKLSPITSKQIENPNVTIVLLITNTTNYIDLQGNQKTGKKILLEMHSTESTLSFLLIGVLAFDPIFTAA